MEGGPNRVSMFAYQSPRLRGTRYVLSLGLEGKTHHVLRERREVVGRGTPATRANSSGRSSRGPQSSPVRCRPIRRRRAARRRDGRGRPAPPADQSGRLLPRRIAIDGYCGQGDAESDPNMSAPLVPGSWRKFAESAVMRDQNIIEILGDFWQPADRRLSFIDDLDERVVTPTP